MLAKNSFLTEDEVRQINIYQQKVSEFGIVTFHAYHNLLKPYIGTNIANLSPDACTYYSLLSKQQIFRTQKT